MNTTAHPVAPEEVMAFLDGELSAGDAQAVSAHLDGCAECSALAKQLRGTSLTLSNWSVPAVPAKLEDSVTEQAAKSCSGLQTGKGNLPIRAGFTWKQWAIAGGGTLAVLSFVVAISVPNLRYAGAPMPAEMAIYRGDRLRSLEISGGPVDKLQANGQSITKQRSTAIHGRNFTGLATLRSLDRKSV